MWFVATANPKPSQRSSLIHHQTLGDRQMGIFSAPLELARASTYTAQSALGTTPMPVAKSV